MNEVRYTTVIELVDIDLKGKVTKTNALIVRYAERLDILTSTLIMTVWYKKHIMWILKQNQIKMDVATKRLRNPDPDL